MSTQTNLDLQSSVRLFDGSLKTFEHDSSSCSCRMRFAVYLPPAANEGPVPWLLWLSGLTCTEENFMAKAGAQRVAAELGMALVAPDTSPRGNDVPDSEAYDIGQGAGFYVNATEAPWSKHFHMFDYITDELPNLLAASDLAIDPERRAISGHSMGGHGALVIAARFPNQYRSVSAFSPICAPMQCPWGEKALAGYLGEDREAWKQYDATVLLQEKKNVPPMLVDQGTTDQFLKDQLHPHLLRAVCNENGHPLELNQRKGYDHSYYFIATFIEEHLRFHHRHLTS